jgi:hypothetical protein
MDNFVKSGRNTWTVALALAAVMWATRNHQVMMVAHILDASWAVFFMLGYYYPARRALLPFFLAQAAVIDYISVTYFGVSSFCVTPAYVMLLPAYASMWLAGRWYSAHYQFTWRSVPALATAATLGALACELFSGGSFYFIGGQIQNPTLAGYAGEFLKYFPGDLACVATYLGLGALMHVAVLSMQPKTVSSR